MWPSCCYLISCGVSFQLSDWYSFFPVLSCLLRIINVNLWVTSAGLCGIRHHADLSVCPSVAIPASCLQLLVAVFLNFIFTLQIDAYTWEGGVTRIRGRVECKWSCAIALTITCVVLLGIRDDPHGLQAEMAALATAGSANLQWWAAHHVTPPTQTSQGDCVTSRSVSWLTETHFYIIFSF